MTLSDFDFYPMGVCDQETATRWKYLEACSKRNRESCFFKDVRTDRGTSGNLVTFATWDGSLSVRKIRIDLTN